MKVRQNVHLLLTALEQPSPRLFQIESVALSMTSFPPKKEKTTLYLPRVHAGTEAFAPSGFHGNVKTLFCLIQM